MRDFKIYITIGCLLLGLYLVSQYNKPGPINWQATFSYQDKIPFGTYILYNRLNDIFPGARVTNTDQSVYSVFSKPMPAGNYIIVANEVKLNKDDLGKLKRYIQAGNTVFITTEDWQGVFKDSLKIKGRVEFNSNNTLQSFTANRFKDESPFRFEKGTGSWYFNKYDTTRATVICINNAGKATYLSYKFGKGTLLLCANPRLFTNYSLLTYNGAAYSARALSYLPKARNIFWDKYQNHEVVVNMSPLRVFLGNQALRSAYYLCLATLLIYVLFSMKRRQRIIPIVEPLKNSTVDFVNVVGRVYFEKRDNANIAGKKILYLLGYLREKYQLKTNKLDSEFINNLANKTGIGPDLANELTSHINYIAVQNRVSDHELIILNQLIEKFYSRS